MTGNSSPAALPCPDGFLQDRHWYCGCMCMHYILTMHASMLRTLLYGCCNAGGWAEAGASHPAAVAKQAHEPRHMAWI